MPAALEPPHPTVAPAFRRSTLRFGERFGLEKIKTVGDAYMAVAGAPAPRADHADAAADMALAIVDALEGATWPTGEPMRARIGLASGPVVAGVIGERRFACDL